MTDKPRIVWRPVPSKPAHIAQDGTVIWQDTRTEARIEVRACKGARQRRMQATAYAPGSVITVTGPTMRACKSGIENLILHHPERLKANQ